MRRSARHHIFVLAFFALAPALSAQVVLHLHGNGGPSLSTAAPTTGSVSFQGADIKGVAPPSAVVVQEFNAPVAMPGIIPSGSTVTYSLWMKETTSVTGIFPAVSWPSGDFCSAQSTAQLTTTLTKFTFSCTVASAITVTPNHLFSLWVVTNQPTTIHKDVEALIYVDGTPNGNYDSQVSFTETLAPDITGLNPNSGAPGTAVTISGLSFGASQGSSSVTFNGITAAVTSWSWTSIGATVPTNALTGQVVVTVAGVASNAATFTVPPTIGGLSPNSGEVTAPVSINGNYFGSSQGNSTVTFNGTAATVTSWSNTSIGTSVPFGATTGNVVVTVGGAASNGQSFTVTTPNTWSNGYASRSTITFTHAKVPNTDQQNFPVLISGIYSALATTANGGSVTNANGYDIIFTADPAGTSPLPFELESYDAVSGTLQAWVKVPILSHSADSVIYMFYGNSSVTTDQSNKPGTWDGNYKAVWHMPNGTALNASDSTSNAHIPTTLTATATLGAIGGAASFDGTSAKELLYGNSSDFDLGTHAAFTIEFWINPTTLGSDNGMVPIGMGAYQLSGWYVFVDNRNGNLYLTTQTGGTENHLISNGAVGTNGWQHFVIERTGTNTGVIYKNSISRTINTNTLADGASDSTHLFGVGSGYNGGASNFTKGSIDEVRISWVARSADWITTEFNNQNNPATFYSITGVGAGSSVPTITALSPSSGATGSAITITGTHFAATQGSSTVTFNGVAATPASWSDTSIVALVPAGATTGNVVVTVEGASTNAVSFTIATPTITGISPNTGPAGFPITITGSGFGNAQGNGTVTFNGAIANVSTWSDTSITTAVPVSATSGNVVVTVGTTASNGVGFTFTAGIDLVSPSSGAVGTPVNIRGTSFGGSQGSSTVTFNGVTATPFTWLDGDIVVSVPSGATTGPVVVTIGGVPSNSVNFAVSANIASVSPPSGTAGSSITITGLNFGATQGSSRVTFSGFTATPTSWSDTSLVVPVPNGAVSGLINVTVGGITSNGITFTVVTSPTISAIAPNAGVPGTLVTITGSNFGANPGVTGTVSFNGIYAAVPSWSNTSIVATVPSGVSTGPVVVTINGTSSNGVTFTLGLGTIAGIVSNTNGPISGATVQVLQTNVVQGSATSAGDGSYSIPALTAGTYDLKATATGFGTAVQTGKTVTPNATTTVNVSLSSAGTLSGTITQSDGVTPIPNATVTAFQGIDSAGTGVTDGSGHYSIPTLSAGTYNIQASATGFSPQTQNGIAITAGNTSSANFALAGQSVISYAYDELGRLIGTVDSQGDAVAYQYDPVGNLLGITRNHSYQVSISGFSPRSGTAGTTVTINGTAFSTSTGQNSVSFNGTAAIVTSATTTQIVATVPAGATTGPISVTSPAGNATSSTPFTAGASSAPTVTGFTPSVGVFGTTLSVTGTNFDPTAANDRVRINASSGQITTTATTTSASTTVPANATSGHVTVQTPLGFGVSSGDFFVAPSGYTAAQVAFTSRITLNNTTAVNLNSGGIALLIFEGTKGQKISVNFTGGTFQGCFGEPGVHAWILAPDGSTLVASGCFFDTTYFDATTLPLAGTYTLVVAPGSGNSGSINAAVYNVVDFNQAVPTDGTVTNVNVSSPGETVNLSFAGIAGQQFSVNIPNTSYQYYCSVYASISNPDGSFLLPASGCTGGDFFINPVTLPVSGTYTFHFHPLYIATGTASIAIYNVVDIRQSINTDGTQVTVNFTAPGQNAYFSFSGSTGQQVTVHILNSVYQYFQSVNAYILNPDGSVLASVGPTGGNFTFGPITLPGPGTYSFKFDPIFAQTGSITLSITSQ